jgi:UDP-glucose 4-epimerase
MPNSLVTGGAGFIGSHVCDELIKMGHQVVVLDDLSGGFTDNVNPEATFVEGSIVDDGLLNRLFVQYRFDYVFHLAAYAAEGLSHFIKRFNYENNLIGSVNLINASVNSGSVECFVFTSSIAVYGANQVPMHEDMVPKPEDSYGIAKYAVEMELKASQEMFGLPYCVFRPHNVYGERQNVGDKYRNVVGIFMNQIMQGEALTIFGDGAQTRAFTHIDDVAPIIARTAERPAAWGEVYNVGADTPYTVKAIAEAVSRSMKAKPEIRFLPPRLEVKHAFSSHEKVRGIFGDLVMGVTLEEGIGRMADWAAAHGSRKSTPFADIEIIKNLPPSWMESAGS